MAERHAFETDDPNRNTFIDCQGKKIIGEGEDAKEVACKESHAPGTDLKDAIYQARYYGFLIEEDEEGKVTSALCSVHCLEKLRAEGKI